MDSTWYNIKRYEILQRHASVSCLVKWMKGHTLMIKNRNERLHVLIIFYS